MSSRLRFTFLIHMILAGIVGALLLIIPGGFLLLVGWAPIDPVISRLLGAALLALAWGSFRGWRAKGMAEVAVLVEVLAAFAVLGCIGLLRHLLFGNWPAMVWGLFVVLALFGISWLVSLVTKK